MGVKVTFFFECGKYGWSETIYSSSSTVDGAKALALLLMPKRTAILTSPCTMIGIRCSNDDPPLDSLFHVPSPADGAGRLWPGQSDIPNTCLDLRMESGALHRRAYQLRGIPDDMVKAGGELDIDPTYRGVLTQWRNMLTNTLWGMRIRNAPGSAVDILTMINENDGRSVLVTTALPHGLVFNDLVYISGRSNVKGFNGTWRVRVTGATTFQILSSRPTGNLFFNLKVRKLTYTFAAFTEAIIERASHRITGRPFGAPVGRRRARTLR